MRTCWLTWLLLAASHGVSSATASGTRASERSDLDDSAWERRAQHGHGLTLHQADVGATQQTGTAVHAAPQLPKTPEEHCQVTMGTWCTNYFRQSPAPRLAPKHGSKECPANCNGIGQCQHDFGICYCPAGWGGPDCTKPRKRPCWRMGPDKRDLGWHVHQDWAHSRCAGLCDDDIAMCYCPPETKYGHVPAPEGSAPGTPPIRKGRPMFWCQPSSDANGTKVNWGAVKYEHLLGPQGWCNAEVPGFRCPCRQDGVIGELCNVVTEAFCANQCSGHGECQRGFCKCHPGWYGNDCSQRKAGQPDEPGDQVQRKTYLQKAMTTNVAMQEPGPGATRLRPYIYVYDVDTEFQSDLLQYSMAREHCKYRVFGHGNHSEFIGYYAYAVETVLHEAFLTTQHRTYDPEEADFFYVPIYSACLFDVYAWNPIPMWPAGLHGTRTYGSSQMQHYTMMWLNKTFPYFQRRGGRDHIWTALHDEGACSVWKDLWPGIFLTHWGRMDFPHLSHTSYGPDNYSTPIVHVTHPDGGDWQDYTSRTHPCYDPKKDLVIPTFKFPHSYFQSPYMGAKEQPRTMKLLFRGDTGLHKWDPDGRCLYSRCLRQRLFNMSRDNDWRTKYSFYIGGREHIPGDFSALLTQAEFCLVLPGEGWGHPEDAVVHGCIPVIVMDQVHQVFESMLDYPSFSVRVAEADIARLPEIIHAIPPERVRTLRSNLDKVWQRFRYNGLTMMLQASDAVLKHHMSQSGGVLRPNPGAQYASNAVDDAFETIIQWLYSRIDAVRDPPAAAAADTVVAATGATVAIS